MHVACDGCPAWLDSNKRASENKRAMGTPWAQINMPDRTANIFFHDMIQNLRSEKYEMAAMNYIMPRISRQLREACFRGPSFPETCTQPSLGKRLPRNTASNYTASNIMPRIHIEMHHISRQNVPRLVRNRGIFSLCLTHYASNHASK